VELVIGIKYLRLRELVQTLNVNASGVPIAGADGLSLPLGVVRNVRIMKRLPGFMEGAARKLEEELTCRR